MDSKKVEGNESEYLKPGSDKMRYTPIYRQYLMNCRECKTGRLCTAYNLSSLIKNQVDEEIQITAKSTNKYRYQANRAFIIGRVKTLFPKSLCDLLDFSAIDRLYKESLRCRSQIMPGRTFRRKKNKAKGRTHFNNQKVAF